MLNVNKSSILERKAATKVLKITITCLLLLAKNILESNINR